MTQVVIENRLREDNALANRTGLFRLAFKMATGTGKTVVMAMLIAWQTLNKLANRQDARFSDAFLIVAPGITIRDRLRVLLPNDPENYYRQRDIVPAHEMEQLGQAKIVITNFHAFQLREKQAAGKLTKAILASGGRRQRLSPRRPTRWCAASAAIWATRRTSLSSTTRRTTATAASRTAGRREADRRRAP